MNIKLVKNYNQIRPDRATLFCFPFAGGGASAYNSWVQKMKDKVTVCPIQLPGREERIMEKPYNNMTDMLDELEETIWKCIRGPYAFWGHSMGGKIAYELEKRLEKRGKTAQCFLVSGSRIPSIPERNPIYHLPDDEFKKALGRFEGTPKEILENVRSNTLHLGKKEQLEYGVLEVKVPCLLALRLVYTRYHKEENYVCINTWRFS